MKTKIYSIVAGLLLTASAFAQAPQTMTYQAVVRDGNNALVVSSPISIRVSILIGSVTGTAVYVETHTTQTNQNGLLDIKIGGGTIVSGNYYTDIYWASYQYFLKTEIDPLGGTAFTITSTSELLSVPYSNYSRFSGASGYATASAYADTSAYSIISQDLVNPSMNFLGLYAPNNLATLNALAQQDVQISYLDVNRVMISLFWDSDGGSSSHANYTMIGVVTPMISGSANITCSNSNGFVSGTGTLVGSTFTLTLTDPYGSGTLVLGKY